MNFKLHHVAFTVKNVDESAMWYEEKFGFKVIHKYSKHGMDIVHLQLNDIRLEFFSFGDKTVPLPDYRSELLTDLHTIGTKHICIEVENLNDTVTTLTNKDVDFVTEIDTAGFGGNYIFLKDCNDILIELYER